MPATAPIVLLALFSCLLGIVLANSWNARRHQRQRRRIAARAEAGEEHAAHVLRRAGYRVLEAQTEIEWSFLVDDEPVTTTLRADYLVRRRGRTYVAEVKTGHKAPNPRTGSTRRQLLEYELAYDCDGVLLVDMERETIHTVEFPDSRAAERVTTAPWLLLVIGALSGALLVWLVGGLS